MKMISTILRMALLGALLLGGLLLAVGCASSRASSKLADSDLPDPAGARVFRFTYAVTVPAPPKGTEHLDVWVPIAYQDPGVQTVRDLKVDAPAGYEITKDPDFGNRMVHVSLSHPTDPVTISWSARVARSVDSGQGTLPLSPRYLQADRRIPLEGKAHEIAAKLGTLDTSIAIRERAQRVYDDTLDDMAYDKSVPGYGEGDFLRAVEVCKGNCTDFHSRFMGVCRASGIPVRFTMGVPLGKPSGTYDSYHCWAHWWDGKSWQPVDISEADKVAATDPAKARWYFGNLGDDRIALTVGRDLTLSPPQSGEKLNYFVFPYAEADGKKIDLDKSAWRFTWEDLGG